MERRKPVPIIFLKTRNHFLKTFSKLVPTDPELGHFSILDSSVGNRYRIRATQPVKKEKKKACFQDNQNETGEHHTHEFGHRRANTTHCWLESRERKRKDQRTRFSIHKRYIFRDPRSPNPHQGPRASSDVNAVSGFTQQWSQRLHDLITSQGVKPQGVGQVFST